MLNKFLAMTFFVTALAFGVVGCSEHPSEHPADHPSNQGKKTSIQDVVDAVGNFIRVDSKVKGGYTLVYDSVAKKPLALTLDKIHEDRLSPMGEGTYFVCADFKATDGHTYDMDFFMKKDEQGKLAVTDVITVHKKDGKARYGWKKKDGVWVRITK